MKEYVIQSRILRYLNKEKIYAVKVIIANRSGVPDILSCVDGLFVAFEVKSDTGETSILQDWNLDQIRIRGGKAFAVRSLNEVKKIIEGLRTEVNL